MTTDPLIVFTSNTFAILGPRSLNFAIDRMMEKFHYLKVGLSLVLLGGSVVASLLRGRPRPRARAG